MPMGDPAFELVERHALAGVSSWRLKDGQIRRRGCDPGRPGGRIEVARERIDQFVAALNLLEVWEWRQDYDPAECGYEVCDGFGWKFTALIDGRTCLAAGANAFPSYADVTKASLDVERYGLLLAAMRQVFGIEG